MNRLRDAAADDPLSSKEIEQLRNTPPTPSMPDMKRRVWSALQQRSLASQSGATSRGLAVVGGMRAFAMCVVVIALAGSAGAMIAGRWIAPVLERRALSSDARVADPRVDRSRATGRSTAAAARAPSTAATAPTEPTAPIAPLASDQHGAVRITPSPARSTARIAQSRTLVLDALIALRRDHDPARAAALLNKYLATHERGALREEALVLAIEAADARSDDVLARRWARTYEAEYPRGRFAQFARSHAQ